MPGKPFARATVDVRTKELLKHARDVSRLETKCKRLRVALDQAEAELRIARRFMRDLVADTVDPVTTPPAGDDLAP